MYILDHIRLTRMAKGLKSEYMARQLGISQSEYSKLENGKRLTYSRFLPDIARILGLTFENFLDEAFYRKYADLRSDPPEQEKHHEHIQWMELLIEEYRDKDRAKELLIKKLMEEIESLKLENRFLSKRKA